MPEGNWEFNNEVASVFPNMLERSIPNYEWLRESISIVMRSMWGNSPVDILDLGCSDGLTYEFLDKSGINISSYIGLDSSEAMIEKAKERFAELEIPEVEHFDLRLPLPNFSGQFNAVFSTLTLHFIPVEYRYRILHDVYSLLHENGIFIIIEKTLGESLAGHKSNVDSYHMMKNQNGYSLDAIETKRMSLENVLVPLTASQNEQMMRDAGFTVQRFWQSFNFCGWIAFKTNRTY